MLHVPAIGPAVVLVVGIASANAAREAIVEGLKEFSILIFGVEERRFAVEQCAIVATEVQVALGVLLVATEGGNAT
mgnify:CR=1 FL=1